MHEKDPIFRSLAVIEERLREKLTVEMLAEDIHFSKYHYQRIFRETVGETVMGYVNRRRLSLAAQELAGTKDSILSIALRYGYDSHEGFTRSFKAQTGVTPTEYRKYHSSIGFPGKKKEESAMMNSKNVDEMVRELNSLIVQAKEAAADTERQKGICGEGAAAYTQMWELATARAEKMAGQLEKALTRITCTAQNPDEISARFLIVKAVEDAAFEASVTAFQVGLMISRAMPEHAAAFRPLWARYDNLARSTRAKSAKIVDFLDELWGLILWDMREKARQLIQDTAEAGLAAAGKLSDPSLPYGYIAEAIQETAEELVSRTLEETTVYGLEDALLRLDTVLFAADMDILRAPQHRQLFDGIPRFREKLAETVDFFRNLSGEAAGALAKEAVETSARDALETSAKDTDKASVKDADEASAKDTDKAFTEGSDGTFVESSGGKPYRDLAMQEGILLFYLRGEIQKLGSAHLDEGQRTALGTVCEKMDRAVRMARGLDCGNGNRPVRQETPGKTGTVPGEKERIEAAEIAELLRESYEEMTAEADRLGPYGGAVRYLAEEVKKPLKYLQE